MSSSCPKSYYTEEAFLAIPSGFREVVDGIVDFEAFVTAMVDSILDRYLDFVGVNLSRHGSVPIVELLALPTNHVYLIDVPTLAQRAFTTADTSKIRLSPPSRPRYSQVFFDEGYAPCAALE